MKRVLTLIVCLTVIGVAANAQYYYDDTAYTPDLPVEYNLPVPTVTWNNNPITFQASLYPEFYQKYSVRRDMRWVQQNDSDLAGFWYAKGDSTLFIMSQLSGLDWVEDNFAINILRYYPSPGGADPLVIGLGGQRLGDLATAAPEGAAQRLNLLYQLSHRMLAQAERSDDPFYRALAGHPLMQPTPYRRDNLALLLTLVTAQQVLGLDSTFEAYQSAFWKENTPGRVVFEQYLLSDWILTADRPLAQWVIAEPPGSPLVRATRTPRQVVVDPAAQQRRYVEGLPLKGQLGFSVRIGDNNRLTVDKIDVTRLGFACGLREGDQIRTVEGKRLRTQKQMVEYMLEGLDAGGATLGITRDGASITILLQPLELFIEPDDYFYFDGIEDTMFFEPVLPDSTGTADPNFPE